MTDRLAVILGDEVAGSLKRGDDGRLAFTYDDGYRSRGGATPLSTSMPLHVRRYGDEVVTPWLWGLLPDNDRVLQRWSERFQVSLRTPFGLLASPVGLDCAGAVRFVEDEALSHLLDDPGSVAWLTEGEVADRLRNLHRDATAWLGRDFAGRFSLAGVQAKTALRCDGTRWGVPEGAQATSHILKPAILGLDDHDLNEHLCLRAAGLAGMLVVGTEVRAFEDQSALVVERYDRRRLADGTLARVHQEDLCQALGLHPSRKYQAEGGPGPEDIAGVLRRSMSVEAATDAVWRFADALLWNWVIAGSDAHAKNYSLLLHGDQARLAPLYDVASALPYAHEREVRMAMKLGGEYRLHVQRASSWPTMAAGLGVDADGLRGRAQRLVDAAPGAFAVAAGEVAHLPSALPQRLVEAVAARAARCASML